ncbi:MAG: alkaline phosphatase family protein [Actinomycetota bacterium]|nr:alkaline phosphatase family protein [Actinomycetota bacterium]
MLVRSSPLVGLLVLAIAAAVLTTRGDEPRHAAEQSDAGSHVFVIVLENHEFGQVIGNGQAPYINRLAQRGTLAMRYFAISHPSLPNYLAIVGGSTFGIHSDCTDCSARGPNLALQLDGAGISWRAYMQAMPSICYPGAEAGRYAKKHNPFVYFPSIRDDPQRCANVVPGSRLGGDLASGNLATFSWITPDLCQDGHDCGIATSDRYLKGLVPRLLATLGPSGFLVLTFDEGVTDRGCCGVARGGRVATILIGPGVRGGLRVGKAYDHYSLMRTLEDVFSLPRIRKAAGARSLRAAFSRFPSLP